MDPASLAIIMHNLVPVLATLAAGAIPVGIVWLLKSHKLRMRELDLEEKAMFSRTAEGRLSAVEQKLASLEAAVSGRPQLPSPAGQRAALLEGPGAAEPDDRPEAARLKQR